MTAATETMTASDCLEVDWPGEVDDLSLEQLVERMNVLANYVATNLAPLGGGERCLEEALRVLDLWTVTRDAMVDFLCDGDLTLLPTHPLTREQERRAVNAARRERARLEAGK